jgi:hypothetical protein
VTRRSIAPATPTERGGRRQQFGKGQADHQADGDFADQHVIDRVIADAHDLGDDTGDYPDRRAAQRATQPDRRFA